MKEVKVYEEDNPSAKRIDDHTVPKDKVMDIATHSRRNVIQGGSVDISGGMSLERDYSNKREIRHSEGLSLYRNSENGNIRLSASNSKNDGEKEQASVSSKIIPSEKTDIYLMYDYRRGDSTASLTYVNLLRDKNKKEQTAMSEYFPTKEYNTRTIESISENSSRLLSVNMGNSMVIMRRKNVVSSNIGLMIDNTKNNFTTQTAQKLDDEQINTYRHDRDKINNVNFNADLIYRGAISKTIAVILNVSGGYSKNSNDGWNVDTVASTPGYRILLNNDVYGKKTKLAASAAVKKEISTNSSLYLEYSWLSTYNKSRQKSFDYLFDNQGILDGVNSYDYTINSTWNRLFGKWNYNDRNFNCMISLGGSMYDVGRDERLPGKDNSSRRFYLFNPVVNISYGTPKKRLNFVAGSDTPELSVEMLRNSLDISDPMFIRAGNPGLRPSNNTSFRLDYSITDAPKARSLSFFLSGGYIFNYITLKNTLFTEDTYLEEYDYTAAKGSQISRSVNTDGNYNLRIGAKYSQRIKFLKSTLRASLDHQYRQIPYFMNENLYRPVSQELKIGLGLNTGFSERVRINLNSSTVLGQYEVQGETASYVREILDGSIDLRIASKYFVTTRALYEYYNNDKISSKQDNIIANISCGRKLGRENQLSVSLGIIDVFNRTNYTSTLFTDDYMSMTTTSYLGRYAHIKASFTF